MTALKIPRLFSLCSVIIDDKAKRVFHVSPDTNIRRNACSINTAKPKTFGRGEHRITTPHTCWHHRTFDQGSGAFGRNHGSERRVFGFRRNQWNVSAIEIDMGRYGVSRRRSQELDRAGLQMETEDCEATAKMRVGIRKRLSRCQCRYLQFYRGDGWLKEPLRGSGGIADWAKIMNI